MEVLRNIRRYEYSEDNIADDIYVESEQSITISGTVDHVRKVLEDKKNEHVNDMWAKQIDQITESLIGFDMDKELKIMICSASAELITY